MGRGTGNGEWGMPGRRRASTTAHSSVPVVVLRAHAVMSATTTNHLWTNSRSAEQAAVASRLPQLILTPSTRTSDNLSWNFVHYLRQCTMRWKPKLGALDRSVQSAHRAETPASLHELPQPTPSPPARPSIPDNLEPSEPPCSPFPVPRSRFTRKPETPRTAPSPRRAPWRSPPRRPARPARRRSSSPAR